MFVPKISISEEYISKIKKLEKETSHKFFSLSKDYFISTNGCVLVKIPKSSIENLEDLKFDENSALENFEVLQRDFEKIFYFENLSLKELEDLVIKEEVHFEIEDKYRKLNRYECDNSLKDCSIARGLMLGNNYNHCANCTSNREELFIEGNAWNNLTVLKKGSLNNSSIEKDKINQLRYYTLTDKESYNLLETLLGDLVFDISLLNLKSFTIERRVYDEGYWDYNTSKSEVEKIIKDETKDLVSFNNHFFKLTSCFNTNENDAIEIVGIFQKYNP